MFPIRTERLDLIPLTHEQLLLLKQHRNTLERSMGLVPTVFGISFPGFLQMFSQALENMIIPAVKKHPEQAQWYTHWLVVNRQQNITVGGIGLSGLPDANGEVMIGYFAEAKAEGKGYTTEAVKGLTQWVFDHSRAKAIIADTLADGYASQKVLQKAGFLLLGPSEEGLRWKLQRD